MLTNMVVVIDLISLFCYRLCETVAQGTKVLLTVLTNKSHRHSYSSYCVKHFPVYFAFCSVDAYTL